MPFFIFFTPNDFKYLRFHFSHLCFFIGFYLCFYVLLIFPPSMISTTYTTLQLFSPRIKSCQYILCAHIQLYLYTIIPLGSYYTTIQIYASGVIPYTPPYHYSYPYPLNIPLKSIEYALDLIFKVFEY